MSFLLVIALFVHAALCVIVSISCSKKKNSSVKNVSKVNATIREAGHGYDSELNTERLLRVGIKKGKGSEEGVKKTDPATSKQLVPERKEDATQECTKESREPVAKSKQNNKKSKEKKKDRNKTTSNHKDTSKDDKEDKSKVNSKTKSKKNVKKKAKSDSGSKSKQKTEDTHKDKKKNRSEKRDRRGKRKKSNDKQMQPDLSPHLHTDECNILIKMFKECLTNHKFKRYFGYCNYWDEAVWQCTKKERQLRRATNPKYGKRFVENRRLPEAYYTEPLKQLQREGKLNLDNTKGCKI